MADMGLFFVDVYSMGYCECFTCDGGCHCECYGGSECDWG